MVAATSAVAAKKNVNARMKFIGVVSEQATLTHTYRIIFYMHIDAVINELKLERDTEEFFIVQHGKMDFHHLMDGEE